MPPTVDSKQLGQQMSEARRRLLRGGAAVAPVMLTALSSPVMGATGQCTRSASRFASHSGSPTRQFTALPSFQTDFDALTCIKAILELCHDLGSGGLLSSVTTTATASLSTLLKFTGVGGVGPIAYTIDLTVLNALRLGTLNTVTTVFGPTPTGSTVTSRSFQITSVQQMLLLLLYLNLRVTPALEADICLSASDCISIAQNGFLSSHPNLGTAGDVTAYLSALLTATARVRVLGVML